METRKPLQLFLYWNSVNHLDGFKYPSLFSYGNLTTPTHKI